MAIGAAAVSVVGGVTQAIIAGKKASKMQKAIDSYQRQELTNAYADTQVSKYAANLQREELARNTASSVQALRSGGIRALGAVGGLQEANINTARQIGADLDKQQNNIELLRARDEARIQRLQENREIADLEGMGNELNTQQQNTANGINNAISGVGSGLSALGGVGGLGGMFGGAGKKAADFSQVSQSTLSTLRQQTDQSNLQGLGGLAGMAPVRSS
tara:strand:- start:20902 stop:21555 length:654 start_codon:yes stop_codon:yes gene_type:complete